MLALMHFARRGINQEFPQWCLWPFRHISVWLAEDCQYRDGKEVDCMSMPHKFEPFGLKWPMGIEFERSFRIDILDREKELIVRAELPGVEKDDVEVTISGNRLMIEAEREFEEEEKKESFYRHELGYGDLMRTIALPVDVDVEHIEAELKDGILNVVLPKIQAAERHTVKVA
jgi:HSP20 family protein